MNSTWQISRFMKSTTKETESLFSVKKFKKLKTRLFPIDSRKAKKRQFELFGHNARVVYEILTHLVEWVG